MRKRAGLHNYLLIWLLTAILLGGIQISVLCGGYLPWHALFSGPGLFVLLGALVLYLLCRGLLTWLLADALDPVPVQPLCLATAVWFSFCLATAAGVVAVLLVDAAARLLAARCERGTFLRYHRPDERRARAAIRRDPLNPYAFEALTDVLEQQKRYAEALEVAQRWELRCPLNSTATRRVARLHRLVRTQPTARLEPASAALRRAGRNVAEGFGCVRRDVAEGFDCVRRSLNEAVPSPLNTPIQLSRAA